MLTFREHALRVAAARTLRDVKERRRDALIIYGSLGAALIVYLGALGFVLTSQ